MSAQTKSKWWYLTLAVLGFLCGVLGFRFLAPRPTERAVWQIPKSDSPHPKEYQHLRKEREQYYAEVGHPRHDLDDTAESTP